MISTILVQELRALRQQLGADGDAGQNARRQLYNCTDPALEAIREQCLGIPTDEVWARVDADPLTTPGEAESQLVAQKDAALLIEAIAHCEARYGPFEICT